VTSVQSQRSSSDLASRRGPGGPMDPTVRGDHNSARTFKRLIEYLRPWRTHVTVAAALVITKRLVYGTRTGKWHKVDKSDRDYKSGISESEFKRIGKTKAKAKYLGR